jgi:hypothetical protein
LAGFILCLKAIAPIGLHLVEFALRDHTFGNQLIGI